ncbi:MAG: minor capsid protein [Microviridae sp.]|nr:MAG: minor capsid protein [Microviridae sp.]
MSKTKHPEATAPINNNWLRKRQSIATPADAVGAKQSFKTECDINFIMSKYQRTGAITHFNTRQPSYGYVEALEFRDALDIVKQGQDTFAALPSSLRARFENDPANFLAFVQDPNNADEMSALGLRSAVTPIEKALTEEAPSSSNPA